MTLLYKSKNNKEDQKPPEEPKIIPIDMSLIEQGIDVNSRIIMLEGDIDRKLASKFSRAIILFQQLDTSSPIHVVIDSNGGDIYSALSIYDLIKCSPCVVFTIGKRLVMSAAVLLLAGGQKGQRLVYPNTQVMIHGGSIGVYGKEVDAEDSFVHLKGISPTFDKLLCKNTKLTNKRLDDMKASGRDFYFTAKEAVEVGIADIVLDPAKECKKRRKK